MRHDDATVPGTGQRKLRVLFCIQNFNGGGAEGVTLSLARAMDKRRFEPTIFAHEKLRKTAQPESRPDLPIIFHNEGYYKRQQLFGLLHRTIALARANDVIVGANEGRSTLLGLLASRITKRPFVSWTHYNMREFLRHHSWRQQFSLRMCSYAEALVSCSRDALESSIETTGIAPERALAIPNGIPIADIKALSFAAIPAADEKLFSQLPTIVAVGGLRDQKGYDVMLNAHAKVVSRGIPHLLIVIGDGSLLTTLQEQARSLGIDKSVHFLGFKENPFPYMRRATVLAHAARYEGFGLVLAEALACRTPVVATDCPSGPREVLDNGRAGILVQVDDADALATALHGVLSSPEERIRLAAAATLRATELDVACMAKQWESLFEGLCRG